MEEQSLSLSFGNSLSEEISDIASEYAELGLDALTEDGLFKDLPFVSSVVAVYKIGKSIRERHHLAKLVSFLNEINRNIVAEEKRQIYRNKFTSNENFRNQELEFILVLIDRYISFDKPQMLAKLYLSYLDEDIEWKEFTKYAEVIDNFLPGDKEFFISSMSFCSFFSSMPDTIIRLSALGLYQEHDWGGDIPITSQRIEIPPKNNVTYRLTDFGQKLYNILHS